MIKRNCLKGVIFVLCSSFVISKAGICLIENESARNTSAIGGPNKNGSYDYGLFQINDGYWCKVEGSGGDCDINCNIPVSVVTAEGDAPESPEIPEELILDDDDSTTHNLERLVSAATCLVAGVEYTHGQQIYRADPCEFCLCLDGEMFCWWQDCPPVADGPCKDRRPFSPCANGLEHQDLEHPLKLPTTRASTISIQTHRPITEMSSTTTISDLEDTWSTADISSASEEPTDTTYIEETTQSEDMERTTTTTVPSVCTVMGTTYKIGEMLPHATGNCLECVCSTGARVTCSPHLCAPPGDDSADYRPPGPF